MEKVWQWNICQIRNLNHINDKRSDTCEAIHSDICRHWDNCGLNPASDLGQMLQTFADALGPCSGYHSCPGHLQRQTPACQQAAKRDLDVQVSVHMLGSAGDWQHLRQPVVSNKQKTTLKEMYAMCHWHVTENNPITKTRHGWGQMDPRQFQKTTERHRFCHCMAQGHVGLASASQADVPHLELAHVCQLLTLAAHSPNPSPCPPRHVVLPLPCEALTKKGHPEWIKWGPANLNPFHQKSVLNLNVIWLVHDTCTNTLPRNWRQVWRSAASWWTLKHPGL